MLFNENGVLQLIGVLLFEVVVLLLYPNKMKCSYTKPYLHKDYLHQIIKKIIITKKTDKSTKRNMCTSF